MGGTPSPYQVGSKGRITTRPASIFDTEICAGVTHTEVPPTSKVSRPIPDTSPLLSPSPLHTPSPYTILHKYDEMATGKHLVGLLDGEACRPSRRLSMAMARQKGPEHNWPRRESLVQPRGLKAWLALEKNTSSPWFPLPS